MPGISLRTGVKSVISPFVEKEVIGSNIIIILKFGRFSKEIQLSYWLETPVKGSARLDATLAAAEQIT